MDLKMPSALTTEEWIAKAKAKHGESYDYSEVVYVNGTTKVKIRCPEHGIFLQAPHTHARPTGGGKCPDCVKASGGSTVRRTTGEWIALATEKHGDRYDYSEVEYVNANLQVRIGCPEHGIFLQTPKTHLLGRGTNCPKCRRSRAFTTKEWVNKARETHGDRYDYSEVDYTNSYTKVKILCREHGIFLQTPDAHYRRGSICPKCRDAARFGKSPVRRTTEEWIEFARETHGDRYDYSEVNYVNNYTHVNIRCKEHGIFSQRPVGHTSSKAGCPKCSDDNRRLGVEEIISQFKDIHGDRYDYSKVDYRNDYTRVVIICDVHGEFQQLPYSHKSGNNCPDCANEIRPNRRIGRETWINRWCKKHGDAYDYSLVGEDITQTSMVTIICKEHGEFQQRAQDHQRYGCARCARPMHGATTEEWIEKFRELHGETYDYSKFEYKRQNVPSTIICNDHGEFQQQPVVHLQGSGCSRCHYFRGATSEEWIQRCKEIHGDTYDYSKMDYVRHQDKVKITCKIHGDFEILIGNHVHKTRPQGCPSCSESGFDAESPAVLYCMKYSGPLGDFWKIGISLNAEGRRNTLQSSIRSTRLYHDYIVEIEDIHAFDKGKDARILESELLAMEELRFYPNEKFEGYTELFSVNPLYA
jgi:hypothetical protein